MKRKYTFSDFLSGLFLVLLSHSYILGISVVLLVLGRRLELVGLSRVGWLIFIAYFIICIIIQLKVRSAVLEKSDNEDFNEFMDLAYGTHEEQDFEKFLAMTPPELNELVDCDLLLALAHRTETQIKRAPDFKEGFNSLLEFQKIFYACYSYSRAFELGGLFSLLCSPQRATLTYTCSALCEIGAQDHSYCLNEFFKASGLNPYELSEFETTDKARLKALKKKYKTSEYDEKYIELEDEVEALVLFARDNIHIF